MTGLTQLKPKADPDGDINNTVSNPAHNSQKEPLQMTGLGQTLLSHKSRVQKIHIRDTSEVQGAGEQGTIAVKFTVEPLLHKTITFQCRDIANFPKT